MSKQNIYFDNAATTPPLKFDGGEFFGNPSSPHGIGILAERALRGARKDIAVLLNCHERNIVFTSGGTESNNLAVLGFARANRRLNAEILSEPWEHPSVLEPILLAGESGLARVLNSPFENAADKTSGPRLVCVSHVCHETGAINDVSALAAAFKKAGPETLVFVDGVQGFCKEAIDLSNIDLYSFSAHKCHGEPGVGGLMVRDGVRLAPLMRGGGQEAGIRPGTENVRGIAAMAAAAKTLSQNRQENHKHAAAVKAELAGIQSGLRNVFINTLGGETSPYILNMSFLGVKGETLVHFLSEKGIYASMGAACRTRKKDKSPLEAMGFGKERAEAAVRFSFSHLNTIQEAAEARAVIIDGVRRLRGV